MTYKTVAKILIKDFGPPADVEIQSSGGPSQKIHVKEQINVSFPPIIIRDVRYPVIGIDLQVRKKADEGKLLDFVNLVYRMMPEYHTFWRSRRSEAEKGVYLP